MMMIITIKGLTVSHTTSLTPPPPSRHASIPLLSVPLVAPWQCNLGMALLWPLQLYWFALLCRKALRQLTASKSTHAD